MKKSMKKVFTLVCVTLICVSTIIPSSANEAVPEDVYLGGMTFGVRFEAGEVVVLKTNTFVSEGNTVSPAESAGICSNDILRTIDEKEIHSMNDVIMSIKDSNKEMLKVKVLRKGKEIIVDVKPMMCDESGEKQLGVLLKDSSAGIGTITYINEDSLSFAGLGHGICDSSDGKLLNIKNGYVSDVKITDINKGKAGIPGELKGEIDTKKNGKIVINSEVGVFGVFSAPIQGKKDKISIASKEEIKPGKAKIICTLDDNQRKEYNVEISRIQHFTDSKTKNFIVKVTDEELLAKTGGIVQGMSGSPIIQDNKLIGAVTHVLVNDPTTGYGIFIENMLKEAA